MIALFGAAPLAHAGSQQADYPFYPFGQPPSEKLVAAGLGTDPMVEGSAVTNVNQPATSSPITRERPISPGSAIINTSPSAAPQKPIPPAYTPWYDTAWGIAGLGIVATGATMAVDHGINNYVDNHISYSFRNNVALNFADVLTDGSLIFMGATWFQSPWSSPKLAHASSVALTSAVITTLEVLTLKYAVGRERPSGPDSSSTRYYPFSSRYSFFSTSFLFNNHGGVTASFPSGHTAIAFAVITPYAQIYHQPWLYAIPVAVGISRIIAVDGHWASDVVAGGFIGWLTADLTNRFFPHSDYGVMLFGDGVGVYGKF